MERCTLTALIFSVPVLGHAEARILAPTKVSLKASGDPLSDVEGWRVGKLNPPLKDVKSDKEFFGPAGDYANDQRGAPVTKAVMDKLDAIKEIRYGNKPYPNLQSKEDYDRDYVKDENSDTGAWKAQFEYDELRKKLADEEAGVKRGQAKADREGKDADAAQHADDEAGKKVNDAQKGVDDANKGEEDASKDAKTADDFSGPPSDEKLKELKKAVEAAEERLEKQKKAFAECERQLAEAKKDLEDLKVRQAELEKELASETSLWVKQNQEQKAVKLNMKKSKETAAKAAAFAKTTAAQAKLAAAEKLKADAEKALAKEKAEHQKAQTKLEKEKADLKRVQDQLQGASTRLQKLHGYTPAGAAPVAKSGAQMTSAFMAAVMIVGMLW